MPNSGRGPWLLTQTGKKFYLADPHVDDIDINDIAAGLSRTCRFNGQLSETLDDAIYTVAQHSVYVARLVQMMGVHGAVFWGLMHDAAEAYYGDMISPLKRLIPEFEVLEDKAAAVIRTKFGITHDADIQNAVHLADRTSLILEAEQVTTVPCSQWSEPMTLPYDIYAIDPNFYVWGPRKARDEFLAMYADVSAEHVRLAA